MKMFGLTKKLLVWNKWTSYSEATVAQMDLKLKRKSLLGRKKRWVTMAIANRAKSAKFKGLGVFAKSAKSFGFGN
ncbi:hypothetical protein SAMN05421797_1096 [Maribacter ulvicola]|uniref:Uncharacterized protein n=1 Tax=Maribacter ulvicola TaxID=228959 RepID=A0A1N6ZJ67_9FLAO|nr:hypothetical protein SAMN05421797_1096 [Maribacter ulvicola]